MGDYWCLTDVLEKILGIIVASILQALPHPEPTVSNSEPKSRWENEYFLLFQEGEKCT